MLGITGSAAATPADTRSQHAVFTPRATFEGELREVCGPYRIVPDTPRYFAGEVTLHTSGMVDIADIRLSPCRVFSDCCNGSNIRVPFYFLVLQLQGTALMQQNAGQAFLKPGDCALIDSRQPSVFNIGPDFHQLSFHLPANWLDHELGRSLVPNANTIDGRSPAGALLARSLLELKAGAAGALRTATAATFASFVARLIRTGTRTAKQPRTNLNFEDIVAYIDSRLGRADLSPAYIARHFNISPRQLYRSISAAGSKPSMLIWQRRLERARHLLTASDSRIPILEVALSCGFKDAAHFSHAYRRQFGLPPRESQRRALRQTASAERVAVTFG